ncbi:MAG TPA: glycoside hydrolase family 3 N-terminal domain-containing protein [bacterium]|nr:glycoside hydrolase family 3 N-terminal domain-containing protein [bacterium]
MISRADIGSLFVLGFRGFQVPDWLRDFAARYSLGGVILFDYDVGTRRYERNVRDPAQMRALCAEVAALPSAPLVFVDQEGGKVRRLKEARGFAPLPSAQAFNGLPIAERRALARAAFAELRALGISYDLAPVVDLNLNPDNPDIGAVERAYSADADEVRAIVALLNEAAREAGLGLCLKHYPGLGGATTNSHEALTDLSDCLNPVQLELFHELAPTLSGHAILVSHGIVNQWEPGVPISMSGMALGALRRRLPDVLLISDDLQMQGLQQRFGTAEACRQGIAAGLDLLLVGHNLRDESARTSALAEGLLAAAEADAHLAGRTEAALGRVQARKRAFGAGPGQTAAR